jgi:uncharacterized protein
LGASDRTARSQYFDTLLQKLVSAVSAGGTQQMPPTSVDGHHFAIIQDPEGNPIGLITPFNN